MLYIKESGSGNTGWVAYGPPGAGGVVPSRQVATQNSITGGGDLTADRTLALVNDAATPGANKVYGTDGSGAKGWKNDPAGALSDGDKVGITVSNAGATWDLNPTPPNSRKWASSATELYTIGDSFTYGAGATAYTNTWPSVYAASIGLSAINLANGSFSIADANWSAFSGWAVTNSTGPTAYPFLAPASITENQNWSVLIGFNDIRTTGSSAAVFRKGLDHLIHWLGIPSSAKRTAASPDASTGTWTAIPWANQMGTIGRYSSSGTLTFNNVIGSDVYLGYIGWGTNYGGSLQVAVDGVTITNFSTASVAYGNREYISGTDPSIPDHAGPYGNGKIDFCPQVIRVTDLGFGSHTVVVTASVNPTYVLWCAGNGWNRSSRKGPNVFVGTIPRQSPWTSPGSDALHAAFNGQITAAIGAAKASGLRVGLAQASAMYIPATHQGVDAVHPNDAGHTALASAFSENFVQDLPSIITGQGIVGGGSGGSGAGSFSSLNVAGTSTLVGNITGNGRLLMLPPAQAGGYSHRWGFGSVAASGIQFITSDTSLDRVMTVNGNSISVAVNSTGAGANLSLGASGQTVAVQGAASVAQTLNVTGITTLLDRLIVTPTATSGGYLHRIGQDAVASSAITLQTGDTALDRSMLINGNSISVKVNSTGAAANLSLGTSGNNVAIIGSASTAQTFTSTGLGTFNDGLSIAKTMASTSGTDRGINLQYTINQASGTASSVGIDLAVTSTAVGSGTHRLINITDDGLSRFIMQLDGRQITTSPNGTSPIVFKGDGATDSAIYIQYAQTLDRRLTLSGNSVKVTTADGVTPQNLVLNDSGTTTTIGGSLRVTTEIELGSGGPTISWGSGAPSSTKPNGSTYHRTDGTGPNQYGRVNGAWIALGGGGGGDALTTNPLSQFASTTSAELAGVLSNESGTGLAVFNDGSTLTNVTINGISLLGTAGSSLNVGAGGTLGTAAYTATSAYQAADGELAAIAGLTSAADTLPYFTGSGTAGTTALTAAGRSLIGGANAAAQRTTLGLAIGTDVQAFDSDLTAVAGLSTSGLVARTGAGTAAARTLTAPAAGVTVSNGDGAAGNPTLALANDLSAVEGLSGTGIARRTGTDAWSVGTTVSIAEGGTGQTSAKAAFDALNGAESTVASASTTDIGAASSDKVSITGTTTITSFGTATAGIERQGRFTASLTLTYNATSLILPGGGSIVTAAGDSFRAYSLGSGNWVVVEYAKANGQSVKHGVVPLVSKSADYTLAITDAGFTILHPSSDANSRTFTIPSNASVPFDVGTVVTWYNDSANSCTIAITTDTLTKAGTGTTGSVTLPSKAIATAQKITSTSWVITGNGI